ncbi:hypothetical protein ATY41_00095 [Leifsonia xyli subsp. xyli]|uniref:Gram-positive cocci surface proteins LPxTG domain-containing protein n=1 Tax=Leifsonia xyli subsp. xyli TaxID=59736 RepID=A0A1E2SMR4_LEIXY|nr:choice-of-anchor L domain-containing protein [Leifsonia xyli]ODA91145.1 hypothetical protein ATY41_00095 [Leifsonia xyli subsp. xyli]
MLGGAVLAAAAFVPQSASASTGQSVADLSSTSVEELVASLVGPGVTVSNATFTGHSAAVGLFSGMGAALGLEGGVALSTGRVKDGVLGPHGASKASTDLDQPGDHDLSALLGGRTCLFDAAVLEFDFVRRSPSISIDYVFGSMEYPKFVDPRYTVNDVFGFFVNGTNCATVGSQAVSIKTVNAGVNAEHFVDNTTGARDTAVNGFTKVLTCTAEVEAGRTNHVKLAIADGADGGFDSVVLVGAGGFFSNQAPTAGDLSFSLTAGNSVQIVLPGWDPDGDQLGHKIVKAPAGGTLTLEGGSVVYTPRAGFIGTDSFTYTVSDGIVVSEPYTVAITVDESETSAPVLRERHYTVVAGADTVIELLPLDGVGAPATAAANPQALSEGAVPVSYAVTTAPAHGTLSGDGALRTYRSAADFAGVDTFQYTSSRNGVTSGPATVTLEVAARPVPNVQSRSIPVFPPAPVRIGDGAGTRRLADTGADLGTTASLGALVLFAGVAAVSVAALRRRARS